MPLKLNFTIPNKAVHAFIVVIVLLLVAGVVAYTVSPGAIPNPGHALNTIQGYFNGDITLVDTIGKLQQRSTVAGAMECGAGYYVSKINFDGTVTCVLDDSGSGDITAVNGGAGLLPDTCTSGDCTLNVNPGSVLTTGIEIVSDEIRLMDNGCVAGEVLKRNASNNGWECVPDNVGFGSIGAVMYLESDGTPANCPSGWTQAFYNRVYIGTITSRSNGFRVCYRTDRTCLVMYLKSNTVLVDTCLAGWTQADLQSVSAAGTTVSGLRNYVRTCYRC